MVLLYFHGNAQISTSELPVSFSLSQIDFQTGRVANKKTLYPQDMSSIRSEDEEDERSGIPPRFGYRIKVDFDMANSGTWFDLPTGDKIWQLNIGSPGALSLNLLYDKFWLPEGAKFFVYTSDKKHSIGAFTSRNNKGRKETPQEFATGLLYGDNITLEYFQPKGVKEQGIVSIAYVVHGYRYIKLPSMSTESIGDSGGCQVNVNCSEGANWQSEKNAVALILVNGNRYCTGSLITTTGNDDIPYFLTADHCLGGWANSVKHDAISAPNLNHWSFYWHYESPTCANPSTEPPILSTVGATVVANNSNSDFALLLLTEDPKNICGTTPYYLGWDRTGSAGTGGVGIHHPSGDIKKIATYSITPPSSDCFSSNSSNYWKINWASTTNGHSVTEGGSSGSPLINNSRRVIGQLYGAALCSNTNCSDPSSDISNYGKFSVSWTGGGASDNRRRLDHWLHTSGGTAPTIVNGRPAMFITGPTLVCTSDTFTLNNIPVGSSVSWQVIPSNIFTTSSGTGLVANIQLTNPTATGANCAINYTITNACGSTVVQHFFDAGIPSVPDIVPSQQGNPVIVPVNTTVQFVVADYAPMYWSFEGSPYTHTISPGDWQCNFTPTGVGDYKVKVRANYGCGFSAYDIVDVKASRPDLTIQSMSATKSGSNSVVLQNIVVKNTGLISSSSSTINYYRSTNSTYDGSDTFLSSSSIPALNYNQTHTISSLTLTLDGSGNYIIAYVDPSNAITEILENNNTLARIMMEEPMMAATFAAYPVPFENELHVNLITQQEDESEISRAEEYTRTIYLIDFSTSAIVYQTTTSNKDHIIDTSQVPSGHYVLMVKGKVTESLLVTKK